MTDRRLELIETLLRHYNDVEDPTTGSEGIRGTGQRLPQMSREWNRTYRELERCLRLMRSETPWLWWDIRERYLASTRRRITVPVTRTPKGPRPILPPNTEEIAPVELDFKRGTYLVSQWNPNVRPDHIKAGLNWISHTFQGEPYLPLELTDMAA